LLAAAQDFASGNKEVSSPHNFPLEPTRPRSLACSRRRARASRQPQFAPAASTFVAAAGVPSWGRHGRGRAAQRERVSRAV